MKDPDMKDHIHLVQFGNGDRRFSTGMYEGQPAFFVEPVPPHEIGIVSGEGADQLKIEDGACVFRFSRPESVAVFADMARKLAYEVNAEPAMRRLSEAENFCLEAAEHYGFTMQEDESYTATRDQVVDLVRAAREQGRRDAEAEPKPLPNE